MNTPLQELVIRSYAEDDEAQVIALWREVFAKDPPWNEPIEVIRRKLEIRPDLFLVGIIDERVVATVIGGYDGFRGWAYHLGVTGTQRRKGIGRKMMDEIEVRLLASGCPKINLQVRAWNEDVVGFYKALGYKEEPHTSMGKLLDKS